MKKALLDLSCTVLSVSFNSVINVDTCTGYCRGSHVYISNNEFIKIRFHIKYFNINALLNVINVIILFYVSSGSIDVHKELLFINY